MTTVIDMSRLTGPLGLASCCAAATAPSGASVCRGGYGFPPSQITFSI